MSKPMQNGSAGRIFTGILFVMFVVALLLAFLAGTNVYRGLQDLSSRTDEARLSLSLVVNHVRANDSSQAVAEGVGPEGPSLVLVEHVEGSNDVETRMYLYNGSIVEEYAIAGSAYTPERALPIVESSQFSFSYAQGLLTITTDSGTANVALRSAGGGATQGGA